MKMPIRKWSLALALGAAVFANMVASQGAQAQNAQWNALFDRIIRLEATVKNMNRGGGSPGASQGGATRVQMRQILNEIRQMRQQLLGMDARIRRLEANQGRSGKLRRPVPGLSRKPLPRRTQLPNTVQPGFNPNGIEEYKEYEEPKITVQFGEPPAPTNRGVQPRTPTNWQTSTPHPVNPVPGQAVPPTRVGSVPLQQNNGAVVRQTLDGNQATEVSFARRLYDRSSSDFRSRRFGAAESGFKSFVRKYAKDPLASSAQFMLGETYYVQKSWRLAAQAYLNGYRKYPRGKRAGQSLLKLGMSLAKLGQKPQACGAYERVVSQYKSSRQIVATAKKEMRRSGC
jgi:tol-pal system protein YbgF